MTDCSAGNNHFAAGSFKCWNPWPDHSPDNYLYMPQGYITTVPDTTYGLALGAEIMLDAIHSISAIEVLVGVEPVATAHGDLWMSIYEKPAGADWTDLHGSWSPGTMVAQSAHIPPASIEGIVHTGGEPGSVAFPNLRFLFDPPVALAANTPYWAIVESDDPAGISQYMMGATSYRIEGPTPPVWNPYPMLYCYYPYEPGTYTPPFDNGSCVYNGTPTGGDYDMLNRVPMALYEPGGAIVPPNFAVWSMW